jgi:hypothetical protein
VQNDAHEHAERSALEVVQVLAKLKPNLHEQHFWTVFCANSTPGTGKNFEHLELLVVMKKPPGRLVVNEFFEPYPRSNGKNHAARKQSCIR